VSWPASCHARAIATTSSVPVVQRHGRHRSISSERDVPVRRQSRQRVCSRPGVRRAAFVEEAQQRRRQHVGRVRADEEESAGHQAVEQALVKAEVRARSGG
jgi:hypothetical protein